MPVTDRSVAVIATSALRVLFYVVFIGVTIYYARKPGLHGKLTQVLLALINSLAFSVVYETCVDWQYCGEMNLNFFRVWSSVVSIHFALAWVVFLGQLARYVARLIAQCPQPALDVTPMFGHQLDQIPQLPQIPQIPQVPQIPQIPQEPQTPTAKGPRSE